MGSLRFLRVWIYTHVRMYILNISTRYYLKRNITNIKTTDDNYTIIINWRMNYFCPKMGRSLRLLRVWAIYIYIFSINIWTRYYLSYQTAILQILKQQFMNKIIRREARFTKLVINRTMNHLKMGKSLRLLRVWAIYIF